MALAQRAGLTDLVAEHVTPRGECGVNAHLKVGCLVAGMAAGADSIDDMDLLRHGAMDVLFGGVRAPSTLGSHLRSYTWGNVAQLERRARIFGESGAALLLSALQAAVPAARFHLMGHSFGCIVASAAIAGPVGSARGRRPVSTLILVQGAMSLWSFCSSIPARPERPGYLRRVVRG